MLTADTNRWVIENVRGGRSVRRASSAVLTVIAGLAILTATGCCLSDYSTERGYSNQGKTQLQFYSPPGATVIVRGCPTRGHDIVDAGPFEHRLEFTPEKFSTFNLAPGRYEFKYITAEGLPGVSVYGELEIKHANTHEAGVFQRRAFVPISLPSDYYRKVEVIGDEIFPYRGETFRTAIDEYDLTRLKQGDVVEKVFVVADLEQAEAVLNKAKEEIAVLERKIEYAEARFKLAYYDFRLDIDNPIAKMSGKDREFIEWERKRQQLEQRLTRLEQLQQRTAALIKGDHVLTRQGMLVLATEEVVETHRNVVEASEELGEILIILRVGGRHMHWGDPGPELASQQ